MYDYMIFDKDSKIVQRKEYSSKMVLGKLEKIEVRPKSPNKYEKLLKMDQRVRHNRKRVLLKKT